MPEKILNYDRGIVAQETSWWCGPASTQIALNTRGIRKSERSLMLELEALEHSPGWDDEDGTDYVRQVATVLNGHLPGADYVVVDIGNDPPTKAQVDALWDHLVRSVNAGFPLVSNIIAPSNNYPQPVPPSTQALQYGGGKVYHYVCLPGWRQDGNARKVWWADPGFPPHGCWVSLEQTASLIAGKGYVWPSGAKALPAPTPPAQPQGMTADVLAEAMGCSLARAQETLNGMIGAMRAAQITTPLRAAHWCAQIGHESEGLRYSAELWDPTPQQLKYDPASGSQLSRELGNTQVGDGFRYRGSGMIMLTGRGNFSKFSEWCFHKRYVTDPQLFVKNPDLVRNDPRWGALAASWYWTVARPQLNALADRDDLEAVTRAINGGLTNLDDRRERLARCKRLGAKLLPPSTTGGLTMDASTELTKKFPSRSIYKHSDALVDTLAGFVLNIDARIHEQWVREQAEAGDAACLDLVKREAAKGDAASKACLARIEGAK